MISGRFKEKTMVEGDYHILKIWDDFEDGQITAYLWNLMDRSGEYDTNPGLTAVDILRVRCSIGYRVVSVTQQANQRPVFWISNNKI